MIFKCLIIDDEPHAVSEIEELINLSQNLTLTQSFYDAYQAACYLQQHGGVDIIFSDINMPSINGIDAAKLFKPYCKFLIFITAHRHYALEAFGVNADAYLVKPVTKAVFLEKIGELMLKYTLPANESLKNGSILFIKGSSKNSFIKIDLNEIILVEGLLNYCVIHTVSGTQVTYISLKEVIEKLQSREIFLRVNKSIIVSANFIKRIEGNMVHLTNKNYYSVGNTYKSALHEYITKRTLKKIK